MFERMILRPSDKTKLDGYVEMLDKLTKEYQDEWSEEYWRIYKFRRGINTELSLLEAPRQNRLSAKIENFRTGGNIKVSALEPSMLSVSEDSLDDHYNSSIAKPPANSTISFVDIKPPPPTSVISDIEDSPTQVKLDKVEKSSKASKSSKRSKKNEPEEVQAFLETKNSPEAREARKSRETREGKESKEARDTTETRESNAHPISDLKDQDAVVKKKSTSKKSQEQSGTSCCAKCSLF
mmetsp:Transcript_15673/g.28559  ORF Transcript_15673/g.28559 Transcript_15673/m.28559 type:complete len:238 (-) Transcript_15673:1683-2396(-)